jgi:hypothetical protein
MFEFRPLEAMSEDIFAPAAIKANNNVDGKQPIEQGSVEADPTVRKLLISANYPQRVHPCSRHDVYTNWYGANAYHEVSYLPGGRKRLIMHVLVNASNVICGIRNQQVYNYN